MPAGRFTSWRPAIYDRTSGKCHICGKKLARFNYALLDARGSWEVEHYIPVARGGTNHANNLFAACISCNRSKRDSTSRSARAQHGRSTAPSLRSKKLHPHSIRHSTAVALLKSGVDFATISQWLGHAGLNTTMRYARADLDLKRRALAQVFPDAVAPPPRRATPARWCGPRRLAA